MVQMLTQLNPRQTVVSVDGVGAFDLVSRNAMLQGLGNMIGGAQVLPFVRLFYSDPSTYVWEDEFGEPQMIPQGEGGEQGDPLMPLLFSSVQHAALSAVASRLEEGERLCAFLDDLYVLCDPTRVLDVYANLQQELWRHAGIQIHQGKTKVWNQGGIVQIGVERLEVEARRIDPDATVWRRNSDIPTDALWDTISSRINSQSWQTNTVFCWTGSV